MDDLFPFPLDGRAYRTRLTEKYGCRVPYAPPDPDRVRAFIPGAILVVHVRPGDAVRRGQALLVLEAMKMQNDVVSPRDGVVRAVHVAPGRIVTKNEPLVDFEPAVP